MPALATKPCSICRNVKNLDDFPNNRASRDGKQQRCRPCDREYLANWRAANPERHESARRRAKLMREYGITQETYDGLLEEQGGVCAICGGEQIKRCKYLSVDHDHETGRVRGLLCSSCNTAVGLLKDDPAILRRALTYLA